MRRRFCEAFLTFDSQIGYVFISQFPSTVLEVQLNTLFNCIKHGFPIL